MSRATMTAPRRLSRRTRLSGLLALGVAGAGALTSVAVASAGSDEVRSERPDLSAPENRGFRDLESWTDPATGQIIEERVLERIRYGTRLSADDGYLDAEATGLLGGDPMSNGQSGPYPIYRFAEGDEVLGWYSFAQGDVSIDELRDLGRSPDDPPAIYPFEDSSPETTISGELPPSDKVVSDG